MAKILRIKRNFEVEQATFHVFVFYVYVQIHIHKLAIRTVDE